MNTKENNFNLSHLISDISVSLAWGAILAFLFGILCLEYLIWTATPPSPMFKWDLIILTLGIAGIFFYAKRKNS